ncbi:MAG: prepilin-type N-terminal cleavage/methylation domain-containing protein [Candidatus Staskawiczbacteria bacterium]|nr:prepilin-type N-terminal cleavage/methylation domain-containing protein [Candidatus Staskawiczbacteria bacterium]
MKKNITGFTIIELLVVIAIIAVLAAIVLINVTRYIDKGKDAAAQGDLGTLFTNAITFYNEEGDFNGVKSDTNTDYGNVITGLASSKMGYVVVDTCNASGADCDDDADSEWCASVELKATSDESYCVDSSGAKKQSTTAICAAGACPD